MGSLFVLMPCSQPLTGLNRYKQVSTGVSGSLFYIGSGFHGVFLKLFEEMSQETPSLFLHHSGSTKSPVFTGS